MRRLIEALLLVLGFSWGLAPLSSPIAPAAAGQGLGAERTYLEGFVSGPHAVFSPPPTAPEPFGWRRGPSPVGFSAPLSAVRSQRRLFLFWRRLRLEGG